MCDTCKQIDPREGRNAVARLFADKPETEVREMLAVALVGLDLTIDHVPLRKKLRLFLGNLDMAILLAQVRDVVDNLQPLTTNPKENPHG